MAEAEDSPLLGVDLTQAMIEELGAPPPSPAHPLTTDALLSQHMVTITSALEQRRQLRSSGTVTSRVKASVKWLLTGHSDDAELDDQILGAALHALHQLDHRTLHQRREAAELWSRSESTEEHS